MVQQLIPKTSAILSLFDVATKFFDEDLSNVRVCVDATPLRFGALAIARGQTIHLHPDVMAQSEKVRHEVLGHELAHIVQQRRGRAIPRKTMDGVPVCDDPALEMEANDLGLEFARYAASLPTERTRMSFSHADSSSRHGKELVQCLVTLGTKPLRNVSELSEPAVEVLSLIRNGATWMKWALNDTSNTYEFRDENTLLCGVQAGLHGTPLVLLTKTKLLVGATKLLSMSIDALKTLAANEATTTNGVGMQAQKVLNANDLKTQDTLATIGPFLQQAGVATAPIFQAMGLADQIAIYDLMRLSERIPAMKPALQNNAAAFAVSLATSPIEFVDLYKIYYQVALRQNLMDVDVTARNEQVQQVWQTLVPFVMTWLDCPSFGRMQKPAGLYDSILRWGRPGGKVGFTRLSSGVFQIVANSVYVNQSGAEAWSIVNTYAKDAQTFLLANAPTTAYVAQDGLSCNYVAQSDSLEARLQSTSHGLTTIGSFSARRKSSQPSPTQAPATGKMTTNPSLIRSL